MCGTCDKKKKQMKVQGLIKPIRTKCNKKKSCKSYPTRGVKKRNKIPMPMIQTYH